MALLLEIRQALTAWNVGGVMGFQAVSFSMFLEMLKFLENMTGGALGRTKDLQPISVLERCLKKEN